MTTLEFAIRLLNIVAEHGDGDFRIDISMCDESDGIHGSDPAKAMYICRPKGRGVLMQLEAITDEETGAVDGGDDDGSQT